MPRLNVPKTRRACDGSVHLRYVYLLAQTAERYLRSAHLSSDQGSATLHVIAWEQGRERILSYPVAADGGSLGEAEAGPWHEAILGLSDRDPSRPCESILDEHRARDGDWAVSIEHQGDHSAVWVSYAGEPRQCVWSATGMAACPDIAATEGGAWVAFHHNLREDTLQPDVSKWISLRFISSAGEVFAPSAPMTDLNRDLDGEEQGFEFPRILVSDNGALSLFGRGSHDFWRQDLSADGFSPRISLTDGIWGSRGRRIAAAFLPGGDVLVAHRERKGIHLQTLAGPEGGKPSLVPCIVQTPPAQAGHGSRSAREGDPMLKHDRVTLFGDIQQHSAHSDGVGCADEAYLRARHRYGDDFVALTDHESFLGKRTGPGEWEYLQQVALHHDDPGNFVSIIAYEWTGKRYPGPGHKCVYLPEPGIPIVSRDDVPEGRELVSAVHAQGGIASPHHIGWTGCDEPGHIAAGQPVWEICSCHGCYEYPDHPLGQRGDLHDQLVDAMLKRGHRFGFTAASDSHGLLWHHGECRKRDPYRTGLTAVQATEFTRQAVLEAIKTRRCYATSGAHILLDFRVNDEPMGSELPDCAAFDTVTEVVGTSPVEKIELVGPEGVLAQQQGDGDRMVFHARLEGTPYVYARVTQEDGEMAWSSPVFFGPAKL